MKLEPLMTLSAQLGATHPVGRGPLGTRLIAEVSGGQFEGERLRGQILTPGADWVMVDAGGVGHVDVRLLLQTDDQALIYMTYPGVLVMNEAITAALAGGPETRFGDTEFFTQPRFETGSESYTWLNRVVAVAEGRLLEGGVEYAVYACVND